MNIPTPTSSSRPAAPKPGSSVPVGTAYIAPPEPSSWRIWRELALLVEPHSNVQSVFVVSSPPGTIGPKSVDCRTFDWQSSGSTIVADPTSAETSTSPEEAPNEGWVASTTATSSAKSTVIP
ncbi:MAG: hypothetical protein JWO69_1653 [Thermoleophilia bacterium]|jgi:hypothetical protein|nr:hypothetical protein [Thermoleophilia bacterium]